jgi:two-component system response regulator HydG
VLPEGEFMRVGGSRLLKTDVRIIASTNRDPRQCVAAGKLREDLFYRLAVVQIALPPLRARHEDILPLAHHFVEIYSRQVKKRVRGIADRAARALESYAWPGNVRELENVIERALIMAEEGEDIALEDLPCELSEPAAVPSAAEEATGEPMQAVRDAEREVLLKALRECNWNRSLAAKRLAIGRRTLYDKLAKHGISLKPGA